MEPKVLKINDKGIMIFVKGNDYFISINRIPWIKSASIADAFDALPSHHEEERNGSIII